jgi:hypothetical protein
MVKGPTVMAAFVRGGRIVLLCAMVALLAGCDRCGDFWPPIKFQACRDEAPRPK